MYKHRGGTLLGFILGLLVGLGAALAVAVYVTKVPIPLVDRGLQPKPDQDAQEQLRNRDWNPNAGLASKTVPVTKPAEDSAPAAAAPAPAAVAVPAEQPAKPAPAPAAAPPESKPAAAAKPTAKDPLGELIDARSDAAKPEPYIYFVQAGAFRAPEEAETQRAKLAMLGFDFKVSEREQAGRLVYRLRLGPYSSKAEADRVQERLVGQGVEVALVRSQR